MFVETDIDEPTSASVMDLEAPGEDAPVVRLVHSIIAAAIERGASRHPLRRRPRATWTSATAIDGVMWDSTTIPRRMVRGAVSRIKIMAELDIAERRRPQDGRISLSLDGRVVDIRLVTLPTVEGESSSCASSRRPTGVLTFEELGMAEADRAPLRRARSGARTAP